MDAVWNADGPAASAYVREKVRDKRNWKITSVLKRMARRDPMGKRLFGVRRCAFPFRLRFLIR